jgi:hypothetical protein
VQLLFAFAITEVGRCSKLSVPSFILMMRLLASQDRTVGTVGEQQKLEASTLLAAVHDFRFWHL